MAELTRRNVLVSLVVIGLAAAMAGAGTMALFSDTEQSTDNTVQAGTLDLQIDGQDSATTTFDISNAAPGDSYSNSSNISNTGSMDGSVNVSIDEVNNSEGESSEAEGDSTGDGDLGDVLEVTISVGNTEVANGTLNDIAGQSHDVGSLESGSSTDLTVKLTVPEDAGNDIQGDTVSVDFTVGLTQETSA